MRQKTYVLAKAILERKDVLFGSSENVFKPQALKEKEDAWEAVRTEMIEQGFINFEKKSWRDVRNHDWQYLRRSAVAKYEHNQKAGVEEIPYSEVDKVVFDIMGNEVHSSAHFDPSNGALAATFNWLKSEEQQFQPGSESGDSSFMSVLNIPTVELKTDQQQLNTFLSSALAASASYLNRKASWEASGSPIESPRLEQPPPRKQQRSICSTKQQSPQNNGIENYTIDKNKDNEVEGCPDNSTNNAELLVQSIIEASNLNNNNNLLIIENKETRPSVSSGVIISSTNANNNINNNNIRKRKYSSSSNNNNIFATKSTTITIEDEIQEAKLRLLNLQIKREEIVLLQEKAKLSQEEAKVRQENAKAELVERQLAKIV